jgi:protein ImuA
LFAGLYRTKQELSMSAAAEKLAALRRKLEATAAGIAPGVSNFSLGIPAVDAVVGQGLARGAVHEVHPHACGDATAAAAFGLALALRAADGRPVVWVRQSVIDIEMGGLNGEGLREFGLDPGRVTLVRPDTAADVLRAAEEAARCQPLGAIVIEPWGAPKVLDLTASRRLALAAGHSGVTLVMVRSGATPTPSAAVTRWEIAAAPSIPLETNAPGGPAFDITLARARRGASGGAWTVEWDRDGQSFRQGFREAEEVSRSLAALPAGRPLPKIA